MGQGTQVTAQARETSARRADPRQYLSFMLGSETLAVGILALREILEYLEPTSVPLSPPFIRGVINLRGAVIPVVDLAARLARPSAPVTGKTCIVIVEVEAGTERQVFGIVVDAVNAVLEIAAAEIVAPPSFGAAFRTDFIEGMGKVEGKFVIILDLGRVLSVDELASLGRVSETAPPAASVARS